jgi:hypothetical protein
MKHALISKQVCSLVEPAVRSVADRLFILTGGRQGSKKHKPSIASYYETGLVVALYEFLLMDPALSHLEIRHENPYAARTRPEQVDLWIRPPNGGREHLIECGDFTPCKLKEDAKKMRRLNPKGTNWFLAFFRSDPDSKDPSGKLRKCLNRKGSLKWMRIEIDNRMARSFAISLPTQTVYFGFALIRVR